MIISVSSREYGLEFALDDGRQFFVKSAEEMALAISKFGLSKVVDKNIDIDMEKMFVIAERLA